MTKSISRSHVRLIASTNANSEPTRRARCCASAVTPCISSLRTPTTRCPIRYIGGKTRDGIMLHDELVAWVERNSVVGSTRRG